MVWFTFYFNTVLIGAKFNMWWCGPSPCFRKMSLSMCSKTAVLWRWGPFRFTPPSNYKTNETHFLTPVKKLKAHSGSLSWQLNISSGNGSESTSSIQKWFSCISLPSSHAKPSWGSVVSKRTSSWTSCFAHFPIYWQRNGGQQLSPRVDVNSLWRICPIAINPRGILKLQTWLWTSEQSWNFPIVCIWTTAVCSYKTELCFLWTNFLFRWSEKVQITQTAPEKKNRLDRFKITFLIRHYNDIVLYMVPPVKIGVRAAPQGV